MLAFKALNKRKASRNVTYTPPLFKITTLKFHNSTYIVCT